MTILYTLIGRLPVPCDDQMAWARWMDQARRTDARRVARTEIGVLEVSTVFLGLNHQYGDGPPLLFETMIFSDREYFHDHYQTRCSTWDEAERMHAAAEIVACAWIAAAEHDTRLP